MPPLCQQLPGVHHEFRPLVQALHSYSQLPARHLCFGSFVRAWPHSSFSTCVLPTSHFMTPPVCSHLLRKPWSRLCLLPSFHTSHSAYFQSTHRFQTSYFPYCWLLDVICHHFLPRLLLEAPSWSSFALPCSHLGVFVSYGCSLRGVWAVLSASLRWLHRLPPLRLCWVWPGSPSLSRWHPRLCTAVPSPALPSPYSPHLPAAESLFLDLSLCSSFQ